MAHKKAGGSTRNGRDSNPKYLGVKRYGGQLVNAGEINGDETIYELDNNWGKALGYRKAISMLKSVKYPITDIK